MDGAWLFQLDNMATITTRYEAEGSLAGNATLNGISAPFGEDQWGFP